MPRPIPHDPRVHIPNYRAVAKLTAAIRERERETNRADATHRVEVGGMLRQVHAELPHGEWLRWLEHEVPYGPRTAQRAIALHTWAEANPRLFKRLAHLGASKLYLLSSLKPKELRRLMGAERILVPGTEARVPLDRLSYEQLFRTVRHPTRPVVEVIETRKRIKRVTRGIRRIEETTAALAAADVPRATAVDWHAGLLRAADLVAARFGLA